MTPPVPDRGSSLRASLALPPATLAGLVAAVVAVVLLAAVTYLSLRTRETAVNRMTRTIEIVQQVEVVLSLMTDAELGKRGYLLTGEERYLEPYNAATAALPEQLNSLRSEAAGDDRMVRRLESLDRLTLEALDVFGEAIALQRAGKADAARDLVRAAREGRDGSNPRAHQPDER